MRVLDLFAGIGGFSLAAHWMGWETAAFVEWDKFCQEVLAKNFPNVPIFGNIKDFHYEQEREKIGPIDLICGGFPCQPFSTAGKRNGTSDDRYLWPEMLRVIREVRPSWVVGENVAGLLSMDGGAVFEGVCASLEAEGYTVEAFVLPAISRGAPHRRDRIWITAYSASAANRRGSFEVPSQDGRQEWKHIPEPCNADQVHGFTADTSKQGFSQPGQTGIGKFPTEAGTGLDDRPQFTGGQSRLVGVPNKPRLERYRGYDQRPGEWFIGKADSEYGVTANSKSEQDNPTIKRGFYPEFSSTDRGDQWREHWYEAATRLCGIHDGVPRGVDRNKRLKALGNAIVPQVVYEIFRAIESVNRQ